MASDSIQMLEMDRSLVLLAALLCLVGQSQGQTNKFSALNSRYQASQPNQITSSVQPLGISRNVNQNIFNDRATIMYKPQTAIVFNDGQEKEGDCPVTRPATGYSSFKQVCIDHSHKTNTIT